MTRCSSEDETIARELNDLRLVFSNISGYNKRVGLRTLLKLPEVKAVIAEGDITVEDLESVWLEACAVEETLQARASAAGAKGGDGARKAQWGSWGVCSELPFEGFVRFLELCEEKASFPKARSPETSPRHQKTGHHLLVARHRMLGLLRAILTLHQRGGAGEEEEKYHHKDQTAQLGEILHLSMVRAAVEEGLAQHTPENLNELIRTGVYKCSDSEARFEQEEKKATLDFNLSKQMSHDDLMRSGILLDITPTTRTQESKSNAGHTTPQPVEQHPGASGHVTKGVRQEPSAKGKRAVGRDRPGGLAQGGSAQRKDSGEERKGVALGMTAEEAHEKHLLAASKVSQWLQSRPSPEEVHAWHIVHTPEEDESKRASLETAKNMLEVMYGGGREPSLAENSSDGGGVDGREHHHHHHHRRPSLDELKAQGIYRTPEEMRKEERQHEEARHFLQRELGHRADVSELKDRGIYLTREADTKHRLERSMVSDQLSKSFRDRPDREDLMDRGVLEASQLEDAFHELEKNGPVETVDDILKWPVVASALKEGVVSLAALRKSFDAVRDPGSGGRMSYQEFDRFLSSTQTTQVVEEPYSLKLWALMRMRPELEEQEHREGNRRRNAFMAHELEHELGKREPLERLSNKGIYLERTPTEGAVERAHLAHTLAHGLAHRPDLEELSHRGIYLGNTTPLDHDLDRHLTEKKLERLLQHPGRPSKKDLMEHGLYIDATPRELQMEHYLASRNLKHAIQGRDTVQDLQSHGVYQPVDSERAAHEKRLVKTLLQRKLSHAFSSEEIARLKQKGIYKEAEHGKVEAERLLVTRQLARLVSQRPDPEQLEQEHPSLMQASTLALVFEERVMPRVRTAGGGGGGDGESNEASVESEGGPEHLVSFEGLMTWPDVQEYITGSGGEAARHEMAQHFELCDGDGDGFITFSEFLRWVDLCGLNPEDHLQATDANLDAEYVRLAGADGKGGVTFDQAASCHLVQRWATSGSLDRDELEIMWGNGLGAGGTKQAEGFKAFCRQCESRSSAAHQARLADLQHEACVEEAKAKAKLRTKLAEKLSARPDLEELKKARIYRSGGLEPATEHLERNLISVGLKEQLLARPALKDLEKRGILPNEMTASRLEKNSLKLRQALDTTMQHDDARWRLHPSQLSAGPREEVSARLQKHLSKRLAVQQLKNKGIYVVDTDASYALLVHQVLRTHREFKRSLAQLAACL